MGMLREQLENADHLVLVLPSVVALVENASDEEFRSILQPELKRIINMTKPVQVCNTHNLSLNITAKERGRGTEENI